MIVEVETGIFYDSDLFYEEQSNEFKNYIMDYYSDNAKVSKLPYPDFNKGNEKYDSSESPDKIKKINRGSLSYYFKIKEGSGQDKWTMYVSVTRNQQRKNSTANRAVRDYTIIIDFDSKGKDKNK